MAGNISDENDVLLKLLEFRRDERYSDVSVTVGNVQYPCHKVVLAATSGYFDKLFNSEYSDKEAPNISSEEVVVVFGLVLEYMYTGKIVIMSENVYDLLVASDFLVMKKLKEHCVKFIEQNPQVEDTLKICYFAISPAGDSRFAKIAAKNVALNFAKIIETQDFLRIEHALLESILVEWSSLPVNTTQVCSYCDQYMSGPRCCYCGTMVTTHSAKLKEGVLLSRLHDWVKYNVVDRLQYFPKLAKYTNLDAKHSDKFESLISEFTTKLTSQLHPSTITDLLVKQSIHLYCITGNDDLASFLWDSNDNCWMLYDLSDVPFDYMKGVVSGHKKYCLSSRLLAMNSVVNQFWAYEKQGEWSELQSTPIFSDDYKIACIGNIVYAYMYDPNPIRNYKALSCVDFKEETESRNIYSYVGDLNKWFVTPPIPKFLFHSYFVSANEMLLVIGGTTSYSRDCGTKEKVIQCFDSRTSQWSERPLNVELTFEGEACSYGNKIFICEVMVKNGQSLSSKTRNVYVYDVVLDQWQTITGIDNDAADVGALVVHDDCLWILPHRPRRKDAADKDDTSGDPNRPIVPANNCRCKVETYNLKTKLWNEVPDIPSSYKFNGVDCEISEILNALVF